MRIDEKFEIKKMNGEVLYTRKNAFKAIGWAIHKGISLANVDLRRASAVCLNIQWVDFRNTCFTGADLCQSDFIECDFRDADLRNSVFMDNNFKGCDFTGAQMQGGRFSQCDFTGANLSGANLSGANLSGANLQGMNFGGTLIEGTNFTGVNLTSATGLDLTDAYLSINTILPNGLCIKDVMGDVNTSSRDCKFCYPGVCEAGDKLGFAEYSRVTALPEDEQRAYTQDILASIKRDEARR